MNINYIFIALLISPFSMDAMAMTASMSIAIDANGIPQLRSSCGDTFPVNKLINYKAVYDALIQEGFHDYEAKQEIKEYLEIVAELQPNYIEIKKKLKELGQAFHLARSEQQLKIAKDFEVQRLEGRLDDLTRVEKLLNSAEWANERLNIEVENNRKKIFMLQLCLGAAVGGILGIYVHKVAQLIAHKMDALEKQENDEKSKRTQMMQFLADDTFKPLIMLCASLGAYGTTFINAN